MAVRRIGMRQIAHSLADIAMAQVHTETAVAIGEYPRWNITMDFSAKIIDEYCRTRTLPMDKLPAFRIIAACHRLRDVAGALNRPILSTNARAELTQEAASALAIIEGESGKARDL